MDGFNETKSADISKIGAIASFLYDLGLDGDLQEKAIKLLDILNSIDKIFPD